MDIYPQDIGDARRARMRQPQIRKPGRVPAVAVRLIIAGLIVFHLAGAGGVLPIVLLIIIVAWLVPALTRRWRETTRRDAPLLPSQVQGLLSRASDPLEREYLGVALTALTLPRVPEPTAEAQVRDAIRSLGAAIEKVPPTTGPTRSALKLTGKAMRLADEAELESDPVVAATLRRRAETRQRQAQTTTLIEMLGRRNAALRQELSDQLDSLQTSLAAFRMAGVWSVQEMAEVAASIQWVAIKANALAAAQVELDDSLQLGHVGRVPTAANTDPGSTRQRLARYISDDTEV